MSIKVEKTENANELKLEFKIDAKIFDEGIVKVYKKNINYFNIPGFRKGKAPLQIVEKHYGSEIFYEDTFNEIVPEIFAKEVKENNIEVVSKPDINVTQIGKGKDLIFTAIVQTKPEVKLGKYKGIEIKKIEYTATKEDIDHELHHMQEKNARLVNVTDRAVENGDIAVIDFEGSVDGVPFDGGKAENHELEIGSHSFIEGFEDQVIGMKIDEEKDINVKFPDEYFSKDLAGKDAVFKVKVHEIKKKELPKLDDEFAKDSSEFDTLKELEASIKERLDEANKNRAKAETEEEAIKTVCDNTNIDIPSGMIETELDNMAQDMDRRLSYQGFSLDQYLKIMNKTRDDFNKDNTEQATKSVKSRLVLEAITKELKLEASIDEVDAKLKELSGMYGKKEDELKLNEELMNYVKETITVQKAIDYVVENAKIK